MKYVLLVLSKANLLFVNDIIDTRDPSRIIKNMINWLMILTFVLFVFVCTLPTCSIRSAIVTFLSVAGGAFAFGAAMGFLFGIPRSEKYKYRREGQESGNDSFYTDNTNLEEISDWLTKIILGLTLIKLHTILYFLNTSAQTIHHALLGNCTNVQANYFVFGYGTMVLYFLAGGGLCFLWTRTNLPLILTNFRNQQTTLQQLTIAQQQQQIEKLKEKNTDLVSTAQQMVTELTKKKLVDDVPNDEAPIGVAEKQLPPEQITGEFKTKIEALYSKKPTYDKDDLQKGRWGGQSAVRQYVLEAVYLPEYDYKNFYGVGLTVRSTDTTRELASPVALFLHDSFPDQINYLMPIDGIARLNVISYEAFVVGACLNDGTELELNLNDVKGFPDDFYWMEQQPTLS